jgi:hypothetical protein
MTHDQNFKNLILDYPHHAVSFFAEAEAQAVDAGARILPIREEQLQERLGERFRELDVPLLVEWPDGQREALLFVLEQESKPGRFSIHRLAHYCLDLAELFGTDRVVPVVIFLHRGEFAERLALGGDTHVYLDFRYLSCALFRTPARQYFDSPNLVARLNLPNMAYEPQEKIEVYAQAVQGLLQLEPRPEHRLKYLDFIDIYSGLDDNERAIYRQRYPQEADTVSGFAERFTQQGLQQGEAKIITRLLERRFGPLPEEARRRIENADAETLLEWSDRVLTAQSLDQVLH